jgi:DNA gyrase inhibitor GyrI
MQPTIEQVQDQKVVYWRAIGEYGPEGEIGQVWQKAYQWAAARGLFEGQDWTMYGCLWMIPTSPPRTNAATTPA